MQWSEIGVYTCTHAWQYSKQVNGQDFKIVYLSSPLDWRNCTAIISLASLDELEGESIEFFKSQRVNPYLLSEIIRFPKPPKGWDCRLAIKQLALPNQQIPDFKIQIFMPVIDLTPDQPAVNPAIATTKNATSVSIPAATTVAVRLLAASTGNSRKHATFYNGSTKRNLYIDTDSTINTASAIAKVAPGKLYVSDIPGWQGEYWAVLADATDTAASAIAIEEYI